MFYILGIYQKISNALIVAMYLFFYKISLFHITSIVDIMHAIMCLHVRYTGIL